MPIQNIFPIPIFYQDNILSNDNYNLLRTYLYDHFTLEEKNSFYQSPGFLQELEEFQECKNIIEIIASEFYTSIGFKSQSFFITQMWANYSTGNGAISEHYHSNSMISGVLYIDVENHNKTGFTCPYQDLKILKTDVEKTTEYTTDTFYAGSKNNRIILFPSYISHFSDNQNIDKTRLTISFNLLPKELGNKTHLNYYKFM